MQEGTRTPLPSIAWPAWLSPAWYQRVGLNLLDARVTGYAALVLCIGCSPTPFPPFLSWFEAIFGKEGSLGGLVVASHHLSHPTPPCCPTPNHRDPKTGWMESPEIYGPYRPSQPPPLAAPPTSRDPKKQVSLDWGVGPGRSRKHARCCFSTDSSWLSGNLPLLL